MLTVGKGPKLWLNVAVIELSEVIVKLQVLAVHPAADPVPLDRMPGGPPGTGELAETARLVPEGMENTQPAVFPHTNASGLTDTDPVSGPLTWMVRERFCGRATLEVKAPTRTSSRNLHGKGTPAVLEFPLRKHPAIRARPLAVQIRVSSQEMA